jgi:hypothetical protein
MKKLWVLLALVVLIAAHIAILSSIHPIYEHGSSYGSESMFVCISKMDYASLRVKVDIVTHMEPAVLLFPNGTQIEIPAASDYTFSVVMSHNGFFFGSSSFQGRFVNLSDDQPINVEFVSGSYFGPDLEQSNNEYGPRYSIYWFTIQGNATVLVRGIGAGF